jgi:hypothetical protein
MRIKIARYVQEDDKAARAKTRLEGEIPDESEISLKRQYRTCGPTWALSKVPTP